MKWNDRIGRRIKLHDLHVLMTVAELGSMGKAAERLNVSQPSISKAMADLEYQLGVRLLDRTTRGVETTAFGRALVTRSMAPSTSSGRASRTSRRCLTLRSARYAWDVPRQSR